jgi:hypothetical protein
MPLSATVKAGLNATQTITGDLGSGDFRAQPSVNQAFTDGAGASQVDRMFSDTRTLAASASESLDLAGGALPDAFGVALTFARVKAIFVRASALNTNNVVLSRPAANGVPFLDAASDAHSIAPGGCVLLMRPDAAGWAVTAGTGDLITLANSGAGTTVSYDIVILGAVT